MNMFSQVLILLVSGILIITGRINFGVFFSIGNFASTIFTELGVVVNQYTVLQSSKTLNAKLRKRLAKQTGQVEQRESLDHFQSLSAHGLSVTFSNKEKIGYPDFQINRGEKNLAVGRQRNWQVNAFQADLAGIAVGDWKDLLQKRSWPGN
jgi:ABC-type multidrug transport system fused ATPase/permease subunit